MKIIDADKLHEYIGDGLVKPFTLDLSIGSSLEVDGQISLFDVGGA